MPALERYLQEVNELPHHHHHHQQQQQQLLSTSNVIADVHYSDDDDAADDEIDFPIDIDICHNDGLNTLR